MRPFRTVAVDQDPLGIQGRILWTDGNISLWAGKPLFDGSQAVLVFNQSRYPVEKRVSWPEIGGSAGDALYVRDLWTHETAGLKKGSYHVLVRADNVEPVSGRAMSALYYDVDLEIPRDVRR